MKYILSLILLFVSFHINSQETKTEKPQRIIVANDEIITVEQLETYANNGYVKSMEVSPDEAEKERLRKKLGDWIGDFVVVVSLYTEEEKQQKEIVKKNTVTETQSSRENESESYKLTVSNKANDFTVEMISGEKVKLSDLKGKVIMLNFWATWCSPCLMEFHEIPSEILKPFHDKDFELIAIARGETKEKVAKKMNDLKNKGIDFNVGFDPDEQIWNMYATDMIPKNFIIDQEGIIRYVSTGYTEDSIDKIASEISKLLHK